MKMTLTYGSSFDLIITTIDGNFTHKTGSCILQDAVNYAEMIFDDETPIRSGVVSKVTICDAHTGEICAECDPDPMECPIDNVNYNPDEWVDYRIDF